MRHQLRSASLAVTDAEMPRRRRRRRQLTSAPSHIFVACHTSTRGPKSQLPRSGERGVSELIGSTDVGLNEQVNSIFESSSGARDLNNAPSQRFHFVLSCTVYRLSMACVLLSKRVSLCDRQAWA